MAVRLFEPPPPTHTIPIVIIPIVIFLIVLTQVLTSDFLRKYVIFARRRYAKEGVQIDIQDEAAERIVEFYGALRRKSHHER